MLRSFSALSLFIFSFLCPAVSLEIPQVMSFGDSGAVILRLNGRSVSLHTGECTGKWTYMQTLPSLPGRTGKVAVLEDFSQMDGQIVFADTAGVALSLAKSSESTANDPGTPLYLGHSVDEIMKSPTDLLSDEILSKPGDPEYAQVAAVLPPIRKMQTYAFVGTPQTFDKVGMEYGGRTTNFDPAIYFASVVTSRNNGTVRNGLVGGYLPVLRFVYPEAPDSWVEMLAFAPLRLVNGNNRIQPVWYRVAHIQNNHLGWIKYIDSYQPFPPRTGYDAADFYGDLAHLRSEWNRTLNPAMKISVPDERFNNMSRFSLIQEMMTRIGGYPKYGVLDRNYGGSEHDGFPDTFTVDTAAMLEWGMVARAGQYIDNYFSYFVHDDGSILYRGPETGQYGRMLTVLAQYANYGGDPALLLKLRSRIDGVTKLLLTLRERARRLPRSSPAYGMIAGWSEADASVDPHPERYMQPYFSNSTEAARGFHDLGLVWEKIGQKTSNAELTQWGRTLQKESAELEVDIQTAISRSLLHMDGETILPSIAGVSEPFHVVVPRDKGDPQFRSYRAYMEMLYSGILTGEQVKMVLDYRARHHDIILSLPTAYGYNTGELAGFLSYGNGYALIQHDEIRNALLLTYSSMAHQYTRGSWTAPETRSILPGKAAAPYCTPAQLIVPLLTKWLLVFEEPQTDVLWLAKGTPRDWLRNGKSISVEDAPTRWGKVSYAIHSQIASKVITAQVRFPIGFTAESRLRLRVPGEAPLKSVIINGSPWTHFDASSATITLPAGTSKLSVVANF